MWSTEQDNMIESPHATYRGVRVFSLYSETRRPTAEMLAGLDLLLVDLQDVGTRVYTYIWTLVHCLEACAEQGVEVMVLDRPNPLGGAVAEGEVVRLRRVSRALRRRDHGPRRYSYESSLIDPGYVIWEAVARCWIRRRRRPHLRRPERLLQEALHKMVGAPRP